MPNPRYSIVIPAYNEAGRVGSTIDGILAEFKDEAEVIVVDDCSKDETSSVALSKGVKVVRHEVNKGKGAAVKTGFRSAAAGIVGFVDSDGSTSSKSVRKVFETVGQYDIAIASRYLLDSVIPVKQPPLRIIASRIFNLLVLLLFAVNVRDTQCGCKAFTRTLALKIAENSKADRFEFDVEALYLGKKFGGRIKEVAVEWTDRKDSKFNLLREAPRMFSGLVRTRFG